MKQIWPKIALLILCCAALAFEIWHFRSTGSPPRKLPAPITQKDKPDFALLPASEIQSSIGHFIYPKPRAESWEPTLGDIENIEASLSQIPALSSLDPNLGTHIDDPRQYFRQYLAVVVNGRKIILLNAFCINQGHANDWRKRLVFVLDGGNCFWHASYDLGSGKFSELKVNGVG